MSFEPNGMLELFRAEVENHSESLTSSLMALERDPSDASILESIMRSAHSLKGAARIVGVSVAVEVAHIMEDCLVAAQRGELLIKPSDIDVLLRGVDLLVQISDATKSDDTEWAPIEKDVQQCVQQLKSIRAGKPIAQTVVAQTAMAPDAIVQQPPETVQPSAKEQTLPNAMRPHVEPPVQPAVTATPITAYIASPTVLTFGKNLDRIHAEEMRRALLAARESGAEQVRYDLSKTTALDPVGLAFLAASKEQIRELALKSIEFGPVSDELQLVLRMSGIPSP